MNHDNPQPAAHPKRQATTWWLTGLSGAGKTTLAHALAHALRSRGEAACVIDGDELRAGLCADLGFDAASRAENVRRAAHMARMLNANGVHAVVALISPAAAARREACAIIGLDRCLEIHVSTPLAVCEQRDAKGLYAQARAARLTQMTGVHSAYEPPENPVLRIDTSTITVHAAVHRLLDV
ncbi:MAG: adenylyl-sulfate kinase [Acidovorax sp.]|nr:MAG: adenylyl-sulfate kinase [Acidovorax sp.]